MSASISVIIPIYNGEQDLPGLIETLRSQTYPASCVEYLLVDNNSRDRTAEMLIAASEEMATQGITLRPLTEANIQSSYAARNTGIRAANSEILVFTDADCRPQPDWLTLLIEPFAKENIGLVAGEVVALPSQNLLEKYADCKDVLSQKHTINHPFCAYGQTANLAVRRQAFEQVGLFRPYLTTGGDADMCWRILQGTDWEIEFVPRAIVRHRHRATLEELRSQWKRYGCSNRYLHELHGVDLQRELKGKESLRRLARWVLKELPINTLKVATGKGSAVELLQTPLDLFSFNARTIGQREAKLPEKAKEIDRL
ncbi:glycosyltransferase [Lusitaniella coriacea LEGE 07157]|uniref:Glycosyltransferase n=1 Tax=Lusitaniella coriacea LEGE 07157 TaxID=945747 RepID=A0A8J7E0D6_9CYAN|nr:glycosyltransferase [Lusitaniella coriacea]MBE9117933.1 glycosyltransferase [Lusitaniella coriacea LEGE 07157]